MLPRTIAAAGRSWACARRRPAAGLRAAGRRVGKQSAGAAAGRLRPAVARPPVSVGRAGLGPPAAAEARREGRPRHGGHDSRHADLARPARRSCPGSCRTSGPTSAGFAGSAAQEVLERTATARRALLSRFERRSRACCRRSSKRHSANWRHSGSSRPTPLPPCGRSTAAARRQPASLSQRICQDEGASARLRRSAAGRCFPAAVRARRPRADQIAALVPAAPRSLRRRSSAICSPANRLRRPGGSWSACLRRMELRGEVRGGRFIAGVGGEQFALETAVSRLRDLRDARAVERLVAHLGSRPAQPGRRHYGGPRIPAMHKNALVVQSGRCVAAKIAGRIEFLAEIDPSQQFLIRKSLQVGRRVHAAALPSIPEPHFERTFAPCQRPRSNAAPQPPPLGPRVAAAARCLAASRLAPRPQHEGLGHPVEKLVQIALSLCCARVGGPFIDRQPQLQEFRIPGNIGFQVGQGFDFGGVVDVLSDRVSARVAAANRGGTPRTARR